MLEQDNYCLLRRCAIKRLAQYIVLSDCNKVLWQLKRYKEYRIFSVSIKLNIYSSTQASSANYPANNLSIYTQNLPRYRTRSLALKMQFDDYVNVYVAWGQSHDYRHQPHWALLIAPIGGIKCTVYHITGGPEEYTFDMEIDKTLYDSSLTYLHKIACIPAESQKLVYRATQDVAPQRCHTWVVDVLAELEFQGLLWPGLTEFYSRFVCPSVWEMATWDFEAPDYMSSGDLVELAESVKQQGLSDLEFCRCFF